MNNKGLKFLLNKKNGIGIEKPSRRLFFNTNYICDGFPVTKRKFFIKYTYYYLIKTDGYDPNKIFSLEYGFHFSESGKTYHLQKLNNKNKWKSIKWTYPETHEFDINRVIDYLTFLL